MRCTLHEVRFVYISGVIHELGNSGYITDGSTWSVTWQVYRGFKHTKSMLLSGLLYFHLNSWSSCTLCIIITHACIPVYAQLFSFNVHKKLLAMDLLIVKFLLLVFKWSWNTFCKLKVCMLKLLISLSLRFLCCFQWWIWCRKDREHKEGYPVPGPCVWTDKAWRSQTRGKSKAAWLKFISYY